jgi:hypothetical protein
MRSHIRTYRQALEFLVDVFNKPGGLADQLEESPQPPFACMLMHQPSMSTVISRPPPTLSAEGVYPRRSKSRVTRACLSGGRRSPPCIAHPGVQHHCFAGGSPSLKAPGDAILGACTVGPHSARVVRSGPKTDQHVASLGRHPSPTRPMFPMLESAVRRTTRQLKSISRIPDYRWPLRTR